MEASHDSAKICQGNRLSLLTDENTDILMSQVLVTLSYYDTKQCKVTDALLDIVEINGASDESTHKSVKKMFSEKTYR